MAEITILIFHSSVVWDVQNQGAGSLSVWRRPSFWFADGYLLAVSSYYGERQSKTEREHTLVSLPFYKDTNLIMGAQDLDKPDYFPKTPAFSTIALGVRVSTYGLGGGLGETHSADNNQVSEHCGLAKLTHKINNHSG